MNRSRKYNIFPTVGGVLFDLDDTLFEQRQWLAGAWKAVAKAATQFGVDEATLERALVTIAADGSDKGKIIDRAVSAVAPADTPIEPLVRAFRAHRPDRLDCWPGARAALEAIRARVPIGLVTDGDVEIQRSKLGALGFDGLFDAVVFSDELGREKRKPHPAPFRTALNALAIDPAGAVYVGDRPDKDIAGAHAAGLRAVRVRTGEYRSAADNVNTWATVDDVHAAVTLLLPNLSTTRPVRRDSPQALR